MSARPSTWVPGRTRGEHYESVTRWTGFVLVDLEGRIVCYDSGIPRLYVTAEQATYAAREGRVLAPIALQVAA